MERKYYKRPAPSLIKVRNEEAVSQFSKMYEDTLDQSSCAPDLILKIGPEKYEYFCHRLMLAAASNFLKTVIDTATPGTIPVILLPDISFTVIDYLLMYVYYGEVQVPEEKYADFVEACKLLELKAPIDQVYQFYNDDEEEEMDAQPSIKEEYDEDDDLVEVDVGDVEQIEVSDSETSEDATMEKWKVEGHGRENDTKRTKTSKFESRKIEATPQVMRSAKECLMLSVQRAYKNVGVSVTPKLLTNVKESKLVIEDNKLMRGTHNCALCGYELGIAYRVSRSTGFIVYSNHSLKVHLLKKHQDRIKN